jgi:ABC-type branched-subunit amino acid transport system substrate-binding protein
MQLKTLVHYAAGSLSAKRFAILYPDENYGAVYMNLFWDEVLENGGRVVGVEAYDPAKTDFGDPIKKLVGLYYDIPKDLVEAPPTTPMVFNESAWPERPQMAPDISDILSAEEAGRRHEQLMTAIMVSRERAEKEKAGETGPEPIVDFDAVFIPDSPNKAGLIIPQLAYYDINDVQLLGTNLWHSDKLIDMAKKHVQGAVVAEGFFAESRAVHVHRFVSGFKYVYGGETPGFIEAVSYDTAWILFDLITRPDIRFRAQIKQELSAMPPFPGVTGATAFDPSGEAVKDIYLLRVEGRRFVEVAKKGILP